VRQRKEKKNIKQLNKPYENSSYMKKLKDRPYKRLKERKRLPKP
jgi:hypothetical protein